MSSGPGGGGGEAVGGHLIDGGGRTVFAAEGEAAEVKVGRQSDQKHLKREAQHVRRCELDCQ